MSEKYTIVCNCGNTFDYELTVNETKTINCAKCGKPITIKNYSGRLEIIYG